jgi:hypothetical protein
MDEIKRRMYQPKTPPKEVWKIPSHFVEKWLGIFFVHLTAVKVVRCGD